MISSKLRPVEAGYAIINRMTFLGSTMKTVRIYITGIGGASKRGREREAYSEGETLGIAVGHILLVEHVVQCGDLAVRIRDLWHCQRVIHNPTVI